MVTLFSAEVFDHVPARLAESPIWDPYFGNLLWVDVLAGEVHRTAESGTRLSTVSLGIDVGAVLPGSNGEALVATSEGLSIIESDDTVVTLSRCLANDPDLRFNDGKTDPHGRAFIGTLSYSQRENSSSLFRLDDGPTLTPVVTPVTVSNGLAWANDSRTMYYVDTLTRRIDMLDYDPESGSVHNRRVFASFSATDGLPDGLCVDHDGGVWVALWGSSTVLRFSPNGTIDIKVELPVPLVSSCSFGGAHGDILFVTTAMSESGPNTDEAGCVFAVNTGFTGPAATLWRRLAPSTLFSP